MSQSPKYLYKILLDSELPDLENVEVLPQTDLDKQSGFIHLSTAVQVPSTLKLFFADVKTVNLMKIQHQIVEKNIKWESPDGKISQSTPGDGESNLFPHLYEENITKKIIFDIQKVENVENEGWTLDTEWLKF